MDCTEVREQLALYQDGHVTELERRGTAAHLSKCKECATKLKQLQMVRSELRSLPKRQVPERLRLSLRSIASREAARRRTYEGFVGRVRRLHEHVSLHFSHLMRPLAVPAAGGLLSAVFLFSMVMVNLQNTQDMSWDVPIAIATDPTVKSSTLLDIAEMDLAIDILVDEQGRVVDYELPKSLPVANAVLVRRQIENSLLFTEFTPATRFFKPVPGWVRVNFRRNEIDVKG